MLVAAAVLLFAPGPAFAEQDEVPVFVIGSDGGLSPFVLWRDSKEFKEVVFPRIAEALARVGIRAIGEEPFRARFNVDGVEDDSSSRWDCLDFLHFAPQVPVDDAGNMAPYLVCVDVWLRTCRNDATFLCSEGGAYVHDLASGERIFGTGQAVQYPVLPDYTGTSLWQQWVTRSDAFLHPLGAKLAGFFSEHLANALPRAFSDKCKRRRKTRPR